MACAGYTRVVSAVARLVCAGILVIGVWFAVRGGIAESDAPREIRTTEIVAGVAWPLVRAAIVIAFVVVADVALRHAARR